ncbi:MAG: hypothetical protein AABM66_07550 [Actinomycetota bacterium]
MLLASTGALGVGLIALPASAAALPPTVPTCVPKASTGSDSCVKGTIDAVNGTLGAAYEPIRLGTRVRSTFDPVTDESTTVIIRYDDDGRINLAGIPACPASKVAGKTIAQAYNVCGPAGSQADNSFLSAPGNVSGLGSTTVAGVDACTMLFKGASNSQVLIWARAPIGNPPSECNNPATNSTGSATVVFTGNITNQPAASPYGPTLTVPNTHTANPALDDFSAVVSRGSVFTARCPAGTSPLKIQAVFDYTSTPTDTISPPYGGTTQTCPTGT